MDLITHSKKYFILLMGACTLILSPPKLHAQTTLTSSRTMVFNSDGLLINSPYYSIEDILLPSRLYILQGSEENLGRYNLYFKNALLSNSIVNYMNVNSDYGDSLIGRWLYKDVYNNGVLQSNAFDLTLSATSASYGTTLSKTAKVEVVDKSNETPVRLLAIGDSLTRAGIYLKEVQSSLPNVETVGTRVYPGEDYPREGRGGWTFSRYCTNINSIDLDSPFVFPVDVDGFHYKGNTRDWKNICYLNPSYYLYDGFQKIARGWSDTGEYLYDENGYYKYPTIGDVMVDPSLPEGSQWVEWDGLIWRTREVQPTQFEFNFTKYMQRFEAAFTSGAPTHISILLGTNDFGTENGFLGLESFLNDYKEVISSIHTYDPNIKIIVCTPPLGPNENLIDDYNWSYTRFDRNTKLAIHYLLETFDTEEYYNHNVFIAPMHLNLDTTNGFTYKTSQVEVNGVMTPIRMPNNSIHPNNQVGQIQMGQTLAATIQKTR